MSKPPKAWQRAANELGFRLINRDEGWHLSGKIDGYSVSVALQWRVVALTGRDVGSRILLDTSSRIPSQILLDAGRSSSLAGIFADPNTNEDVVVTGDREFDDRIHARGASFVVLAALTHEARRAARALFADGWYGSVEHGVIDCRANVVVGDATHLVDVVRKAVVLAKLLSFDRAEAQYRLVENAVTDPDYRVRARILDVLTTTSGPPILAETAARNALRDPAAELRIAGARELGKTDIDALLELARNDPDPGVRAALIGELASFAGERLWPVLKQALRGKNRELRRAAIEAARKTRYLALAPRIARRAAKADAESALVIAQTLGEFGDPSTEPALIGLLAHASDDVRGSAAEALGRFGSVVAVEALLACGERAGLLESDVKRAAMGAIGAIQARLGEVEAGTLSLVGASDDAGAVSLADTAADGALSLDHES